MALLANGRVSACTEVSEFVRGHRPLFRPPRECGRGWTLQVALAVGAPTTDVCGRPHLTAAVGVEVQEIEPASLLQSGLTVTEGT